MDQVEEVKSKVDLIEVISSYVPLKKAGRNFAGLCPFHSEKTPSFMVSGERQVWKCFGCGEGGDVFTFLEKMEGWDFREALEEMAKRVGVKLKSFAPSDKSKTREKLIAIHNLVSKFYSHLLLNHPNGQDARDYLKKRGVKKELWEKFSLGFSPNEWESTLNFLTKRGFSLSEIATSGLVVARERSTKNSFYDRFRNRLMFPLKDGRGVVLGFAGRIIEQETGNGKLETGPKYLNSPQTPIFEKGSLLFGFDETRSAIKNANEAVLVEGEFDFLSCYQVGVENVVASKGTALTQKQVAILSRICENVALCFDSDMAGDAASWRGIELLDLAGVNVKVVRFGKHKDPDDFIKNDPKGFRQAIEKTVNVYDYFIESATKRYDPTSAEGKKKIGREVIPILGKISDDLVRAHYVGKLAKILDLDVNLVNSAVTKKTKIEIGNEEDTSKKVKKHLSPEEYFLALFLAGDLPRDWDIKPSDFENEQAKQFWKLTRDIINGSKTKILKDIVAKLPKSLGPFIDNLYLVSISPFLSDREMWAEEISIVAKRLKAASLKRQLVEVSEKIKNAEKAADDSEVVNLTKKFNDIMSNLEERKVA